MHWGDPLTLNFWLSLGLTVLCGGVIGLERQLRGKPAGVRTSILVCMGTFLFVHLSRGLDGTGTDPTRVLGQVVTGIGFLGAGVTLSREGTVKGVTSAAVIWVLAAIGAAIGLGQAGTAVAIAGVVVIVLMGVHGVERAWRKLRGVFDWEDKGDD
jgi:putative Mg2+ transporter-C (MgtC) family protein